MDNKSPRICVVGSSNYDLVAYTDRIPKLGETIHGNKFEMGFGGKGANQAVTAAKLGANVTMITKLGEDVFGKQTLENFEKCGVNTDYVYFTDKASSGVAPITVNKEGNNSIIVIAGANNLITEEEVEAARPTIAASKAVICQMETLLNVTKRAMQIAREEGVTTIFNPAPAPEDGFPEEILKLSDIFCPNESETELLTGMPVTNIEEAIAAGRCLINKGPKKVLMTLGEKGSLLITPDDYVHVEPYSVEAVDTTGAGDCFIGSYAYFHSAGVEEREAIRRANYIAALSVQKPGTQKSYPSAAELPDELFE
ncbi:MAG TPA: ribokinase [Victivallales bacterium]|nr:ribokinase [Victivallales bacterium]